MSVRCLIVDDSATMRALLTGLLQRDPDIEVIGCANDAQMAREMIRRLNPDVMTLDVEMPGMNGLDFLKKVMRLRPMPVVMCSTLTAKGAEATVGALAIGAIDCYAKPEGTFQDVLATDDGCLANMVKQAARSRRFQTARAPVPRPSRAFRGDGKIVAIGGIDRRRRSPDSVIERVSGKLPADRDRPAYAGDVHGIVRGAAQRLLRTDHKEAFDGAPLLPGHVYIAPGSVKHLMVYGGRDPHCRLVDANAVSGHRPSVDVLFRSVAQTQADRAVGVILTGMGRDGAAGLLDLRRAGARTIGQNDASCVVYGMPRAAAQIDACEEMLPLDAIARKVLDLCSI